MVVDRTVKVPCSRGLEARMWLEKHPDTFVGRRACGAHVALNNQVFSNSPIFRQPSVDIVSAESGASQTVTFQNFLLLTEQASLPVCIGLMPPRNWHPTSTMQVDSIAEACEDAAKLAETLRNGMKTRYYILDDPARYLGNAAFNENNQSKHFMFEFSSIPSHPTLFCVVAAVAFKHGVDKDNEDGLKALLVKVNQIFPGNPAAQQLTTEDIFAILFNVTKFDSCQCPVTSSDSSENISDTSTESSDESSDAPSDLD